MTRIELTDGEGGVVEGGEGWWWWEHATHTVRVSLFFLVNQNVNITQGRGRRCAGPPLLLRRRLHVAVFLVEALRLAVAVLARVHDGRAEVKAVVRHPGARLQVAVCLENPHNRRENLKLRNATAVAHRAVGDRGLCRLVESRQPERRRPDPPAQHLLRTLRHARLELRQLLVGQVHEPRVLHADQVVRRDVPAHVAVQLPHLPHLLLLRGRLRLRLLERVDGHLGVRPRLRLWHGDLTLLLFLVLRTLVVRDHGLLVPEHLPRRRLVLLLVAVAAVARKHVEDAFHVVDRAERLRQQEHAVAAHAAPRLLGDLLLRGTPGRGRGERREAADFAHGGAADLCLREAAVGGADPHLHFILLLLVVLRRRGGSGSACSGGDVVGRRALRLRVCGG
eukprot:Rhum_TRINITY_DN14342_c20_g1::Rhum_TRINITY_DN14342_c20_g1_i1::g.81251::m.81251